MRLAVRAPASSVSTGLRKVADAPRRWVKSSYDRAVFHQRPGVLYRPDVPGDRPFGGQYPVRGHRGGAAAGGTAGARPTARPLAGLGASDRHARGTRMGDAAGHRAVYGFRPRRVVEGPGADRGRPVPALQGLYRDPRQHRGGGIGRRSRGPEPNVRSDGRGVADRADQHRLFPGQRDHRHRHV